MKIIETNIIDIDKNCSLDKLKNNLLNKIIEKINPLINKQYIKKIKEIKKIMDSINDKKNIISNRKLDIKNIYTELEKKKGEKILLSKLNRLVLSNLIQDSKKQEAIDLINNFDTLDKNKIKDFLSQTLQIISQKFAKN